MGGVRKIKLNADTSGYAEITSSWWGGRVTTAFGGYPFASVFPSFMIYLLEQGFGEVVLWTLTMMLCLSAIFWLRDLMSLAWASPLIAGFIMAIKYHINLDWALFILMTIILLDSLSSSLTVARLSLRNYRSAGDATDLFDMTLIPPQIWGIIFVLISFLTFGYTVLLLVDLVPDYYSNVITTASEVFYFIEKFLRGTP
jgi:hypothetical protein